MSKFRYDALVQKALISVVKEVLTDVAANGLSDNHHFYIRFRTDHSKVKVPSFLKEQHPEEVMIVLQHQFKDLRVNDRGFFVELSFNGMPETLYIPFASLTAFVDPSVKFALQFSPTFDSDDSPGGFDKRTEKTTDNSEEGKIISFDSFRKK